MRMSEMTDAYVKLDKVSKIYGTKEVKIVAVDEISFEIAKGEFVVIVGPSGAGKTTVLNILGGMDKATSGEVLVDGRNIARYNSRQLTGYRRNDIGFVFQFYNLVPNLTALENVELALQICKNPLDAREVLEEVGLKDRLTNFPAQLSGGEQQVVSLCGFGKKVGIVCCGKCAGILILKTLDHCGYDRISDCQHYYQECRQHHSVRCQQSFCLILHICSFGSDSSSEFRSRYPIFR